MNYEKYHVENVLSGKSEDAWLYFEMELEDYLTYDDPDIYD